MIKLSRATDSIWRVADLEYGDPHEDEEDWFRDKHNMYKNYGDYSRSSELMTLVPGWDEAKRRGWKPISEFGSPMAYRGSGNSFEFIGPKHLNPDEDHWESIPQRWIRYSQGEGGTQNPYVMHADTFRDAINDRNLRGWNLYQTARDPETDEIHRVLNRQYPGKFGPKGHTDDFKDYKGGPGYFENIKNFVERHEKGLAGEA